jgi:PAS domain S-box-containing protein
MDPSGNRAIPLQRYLVQLYWLCVLPLLLLAAWLVYDNVRSIRSTQDQQGSALADHVTTAVDQLLQARITALRIVAQSPHLDRPDELAQLYDEALGVKAVVGMDVVLVEAGPQRRMVFNTQAPLGTPMPPTPRTEGLQALPAALQTRQPAVGDHLINPFTQQHIVVVAVPVVRNGEAVYAEASPIEVRDIQQQVDGFTLPTGWTLTLHDGMGHRLANKGTGQSPEDANTNANANANAEAQAGKTFDRQPSLARWQVRLTIPPSARNATMSSAALAMAALLFAATLLGALVGRAGGQRLGQAVTSLTRDDEAAGLKIAEIQSAQQLLDQTAAQQRQSETRYRRLFESSPVGMRLTDNQGQVLAQNASFERMFGYTMQEAPTLQRWMDLAYPNLARRQYVEDAWREVMRRSEPGGTEVFVDEFCITAKGGRELEVQVRGSVQVDGLLTSFIDMTERKRAEAALQTLHTSLERRVLDRTAKLTQANHELDSFAYTVSHDLRAPLRALDGYLHMLREEVGPQVSPDGQHCLDQIGAAADRMHGLIEGILTLSHSVQHELQLQWVDLSALVARRLDELATNEPGRDVTTQVEPGRVAVGDPRMLDVLVTNLVDNAWKYTARTPQPRIRFFTRERDGKTWFCVSDNGAGFDPAYGDKLFQPFQRMHRQDEFPGIGIGLATVHRIVQRHRGQIVVEASPGQGACFSFTLGLESDVTP